MLTHHQYKHEADLGPYLGHYLTDVQTPSKTRPKSGPGRRDVRHERRYPVNELASVFSPTCVETDPMPVKLVDVSAAGLGIMAPKMIPCGTAVQVVLEHAFVLGEVRHCTPAGDAFRAGVLIKDVLRSAK
jgi:hypothetical protein